MHQKKVFKSRTFDRWAKKVIADVLLCRAAFEIEQGRYEADLGQGVCKKRIALPGKGKSGSTRTLVAKQHKTAIFFIAGRAKSDPGTDFTDKEVEAAKLIAGMLQAANAQKLGQMVAGGALKEICNGEKDDE